MGSAAEIKFELRWHLDEIHMKINAEIQYLWRAEDHDGEVSYSPSLGQFSA